MGRGVLDTLAACQATDGAFDEPVATQQGVVDAAKNSGGSAKTVANLQTRLHNYQNMQITIALMAPMFESDLEDDAEVE
ncbi:MAG: hypothetical protein IPK97_04280 [Ahniella sp.]|nr:hypothetical protein [Ahniella sp.]